MNWTAAAIITNLLLWVVMFADIITDMKGGIKHDTKKFD